MKAAPVFLDLSDILRLHAHQIKTYGGREGVRDLGALEAALAMPRATFGGEYLHPDLFEMAAAYLFHLCQDHPFIDGNKRVGAAAAFSFLYLNGRQLGGSQDGLRDLVLATTEGKAKKAAIAAYLRRESGKI